MRRYFSLIEARQERPGGTPRAATLGFFDGVHRGHIHILDDLERWALETGAEPVVVTFDRHPQAVLGGHPPVPVVSLEHRLLLLQRQGLAATLVLPFDRELASWSAERFIREVLTESLGARFLLFGYDGAFGKGREGTYESIAPRSAELGIEVRRSEPRLLDGGVISSTLLRGLLAAGQLDRVASLLGRPFSQLGRVVHGDHRGRSLGFPTANLDIGEAGLLPRGVYFANAVRLGDRPEEMPFGSLPMRSGLPGPWMPAVVNVGRRPTFSGEAERSSDAFDPTRDKVEVHLLDFDGDLYGEYLEVFFVRRHRDEARFPSVEALQSRIRADVAERRVFARSEPPP